MSKSDASDSTTAVAQSVYAARAAREAVLLGYQPVPLRAGQKAPAVPSWTRLAWEQSEAGADEAERQFTEWAETEGAGNVGILLGEPSGGLIDVDLDHPATARVKRFFLPPTRMKSGRPGRPASHFWYRAKEGTLPSTRRYKMPGGAVSVEVRTSGSQTVIPPSIHPSGEDYRWEGEPWGGEAGPALVDGRVLVVQVALLALGSVLIERWPSEGSRHDTYLALAGGLLRYGQGVHPYWSRNVGVLIRALAEATHDDADERESEVIETTVKRLQRGDKVAGFGVLAEHLGKETVDQVRRLVAEVESAAGFVSEHAAEIETSEAADGGDVGQVLDAAIADREALADLGEMRKDPLSARIASWEPVNLDPYLAGEVTVSAPDVLRRTDGHGLMYAGKVNMLYGSSESAKTWVALNTCLQEIARGERVMYLDFEDEPASTLGRLMTLGAAPDDLRTQFSYVRPEDALAAMQRSRWGDTASTEEGRKNLEVFTRAVETLDPTLIVADGMTVLYGLHGLDTNDAGSTDVITGWLKRLTRNGRTTVIVIDHTTKNADKGALPIGSQHKVAMVQGTMLQVWPVTQPMPGALGEVELVVLKDRPGEVRKISTQTGVKAQVSASVIIDSRTERTTMTINPPRAAGEVSTGPGGSPVLSVDLRQSSDARRAQVQAEVEDRILRVYGNVLGERRALSEITQALPELGPQQVRNGVLRLVDQGVLVAEGATRSRRYILAVAAVGVDDEPLDE